MNVVRLKQVAVVRYGLGQPPPASPAGIPILRATNIERGRINPDDMIFAAFADLPLGRAPLLKAGEVLVVRSGAYTGDSALITSEWEGSAPGYDLRLTPRKIDARFLAYQLLGSPVLDQIELAKTRAAQPHLNAEDLGDVVVTTSTPDQEVAIADYLDAETAQIDAVVEAKRRLSEVLDQRRRTVIGAAVTGGLTQPSTAVSEAPPRPLRAFAEVALGKARSPDTAEGPHMVQYLRAANVKNGFLALDTITEMNFTPAEQRAYALRPADVLVTEGAGSLAAVGANAVWNGEIEGTICYQNHLVRLRATARGEPRFIAWWTRFAYESGLFASLATGAQILNLGAEHVRALRVRMPSRDAQKAIADLLDAQVGSIESARTSLTRQIELLLERRQAIITAAVTGQLEIPGVAA